MVIEAVIVCLFTICDRKARALPEPAAHNKREMGDLRGAASEGEKSLPTPVSLQKEGDG